MYACTPMQTQAWRYGHGHRYLAGLLCNDQPSSGFPALGKIKWLCQHIGCPITCGCCVSWNTLEAGKWQSLRGVKKSQGCRRVVVFWGRWLKKDAGPQNVRLIPYHLRMWDGSWEWAMKYTGNLHSNAPSAEGSSLYWRRWIEEGFSNCVRWTPTIQGARECHSCHSPSTVKKTSWSLPSGFVSFKPLTFSQPQ